MVERGQEGQPLEPATRTAMELRFHGDFSRVPPYADQESTQETNSAEEDARRRTRGRAGRGGRPDFSRVRIHTGEGAAETTDALGAQAFTYGANIAFAPGRFDPREPVGRELLAHELAHVLQGSGGIARAVSPQYPTIKKNLTYGLFDWAITDAEAHQVLGILQGLSPADFTDTVQQMEKDGLVNRLLENIADSDRTAFAPLIQKLHQERGGAETARFIESLMSYGLLDWVITDEEAHMALEALKSLQPTPAKFKDVVARIPRKQYERFYDNLSERDRRENLPFLQEIEIVRSSGMTLDELGEEQRKHLEAKAAAAGVSTGTFIRGEAAAHGYGGNPATWWPSLTPAQKASWTKRFQDAVAAVKAAAPEELKEAIRDAEAAGGGIRWEPEKTEELGAFAWVSGNIYGVGKSWVEAAESNPKNAYESISHEVGGHRRYGDTTSWKIMQKALGGLPAAEQAIASSGAKSPFTAYGYMETEMYAELRELPYHKPGEGVTDDPRDDVPDQMQKIKDAFEPKVAEAIIRGFRRRIQMDPGVTDEGRDLFDKAAKKIFGIDF